MTQTIKLSNTKHTPGPWYVDGWNTTRVIYPVKDEKMMSGNRYEIICSMNDNVLIPVDIQKANAQLIAASPELLKTLEASNSILFMLWEIETNIIRRDVLADQMTLNSAAIAKAKGE